MSEQDTKTILRLAKKLEQSQQENIELEKENKRYRKLLEEIIDEGSCLMIDKISNIIHSEGKE